MRIQTPWKESNFLFVFKEMRKQFVIWIEFIDKNFRSHISSKSKMTHITMLNIMMLMGNFGLVAVVFVMTYFFRKLLHKMLIHVQ